MGVIAWPRGEVQAYESEYNGWTYANLQLVGRVGGIEVGNFEEHKPQAERQSELLRVQTSPKRLVTAAGYNGP